jgi:glycine betaine/proline transport system permease protein
VNQTQPGRARPLTGIPIRSLLLTFGLSGLVIFVAWRFGVHDPAAELQGWVRDNEDSSPVFTGFIDPVSDAIKWMVRSFSRLLEQLPWFCLPTLAALAVGIRRLRSGSWRSTLILAVAVGCVALLPGFVGLQKLAMQTTALTSVAVLISLAIGVPLGVAAALRPSLKVVLRPLLDAMQTIPSTVYLVPATLFFGIGVVPAVVATVVFALPPAVRLTMLGIEQVPPSSVEAGVSFGATRWQLLRTVQLPLAMPSIATGINQTVMMALGIVVVATLVGAGGLGQEVLNTLQIRAPGRGMVVGLAIVAVATVFDRVSASMVPQPRSIMLAARTRLILRALIILTLIISALSYRRFTAPPVSWGTAFADPVDEAILWVRDNGAWLTKPLNDFIVRHLLIRGRDLLTETIPIPVTVIGVAVLALWLTRKPNRPLAGWRLATGVATGLSVIAYIGTWRSSMETLIQVLFASVIAVAVALPIGVAVGQRPRLERAVAPLLDALQTVPSLIYTIPFVMIFTVSVVPGGIIASALYAIPAGIRVAALGIREVPSAPIEAATSFGATRRQRLFGVALPLARPALLLALNQIIMMVLSMVVIAGMTGAGALGYEAVKALTLNRVGIGAQVGVSIVILAMILDRLTEQAGTRGERQPIA